MSRINFKKNTSFILYSFFLLFYFSNFAQESGNYTKNYDSAKNWRFGGGLGLSIGSGYTNVMIAPSALYDINPYVSLGVGLQGSYINSKSRSFYINSVSEYNSWIYGGSLIAISNPIPELQLSAELEQLRVNNTYTYKDSELSKDTHNFWNTALFLGVGYNSGPVTVGVRYNVLYNSKDMVYGSPFMPFIRAYF